VLEQAAEWLVLLAEIYLALGLAFGVVFVTLGIQRIDPGARGAGLGFRLLVLPGSVALWPLLLRRWLTQQGPPEERNAHRERAHGSQT
jgi:hypothetical protein